MKEKSQNSRLNLFFLCVSLGYILAIVLLFASCTKDQPPRLAIGTPVTFPTAYFWFCPCTVKSVVKYGYYVTDTRGHEIYVSEGDIKPVNR